MPDTLSQHVTNARAYANNKRGEKYLFTFTHQEPRLTGEEFMNIVEEFMTAVYQRWPRCVVQFEDFSSDNALTILEKYRHQVPSIPFDSDV